MNKLIIKNFGPLKNINIDIKDIMIFIGPQASGKSTLAKILSIISGETLLGKNETEFHQFFKDQHINFFSDETIISYGQSDIYKNGKLNNSKINNSELKPLYIPAERILVSMLSESMMGMMANKIAIPDFILQFGSSFEIARKKLDSLNIKPLNVTYRFENGIDKIYLANNKELPLSQTASGLQAAIPLYLILKYFSSKQAILFAIEEPELNLYPETQKNIVEYIIQQCTNKNNKLVITTHSPYILTALNNLIQANNVVKAKPFLKDKVNQIIPSDKWLDFERVAVYSIENGIARNMMNEELKVIDATIIDEVSEKLGEEFEQLLELEYEE